MRPALRWAIAAVLLLALGFLIGAWAVTSRGLRIPFLPEREQAEEDKEKNRTAGESEAEGETAKSKAIASVRTVKAVRSELRQTIDVYGSIAPRVDAMISVSAKSEVVVRRILVRAGDAVAVGDPVLEVEPSPATNAHFQIPPVNCLHPSPNAASHAVSLQAGSRGPSGWR